MFKSLAKIIPRKHLISLYRKMPLPRRVKQTIVFRSNERFLVAVLGIITNDDGQVLLLHHTYTVDGKDEPWRIPSGYIEKEEPAEGLKREIFEETNFVVEIDKLLHSEYANHPPRINLYFSGRIKSGVFKPCEEVSEYRFFDIKDFPKYMPKDQKGMMEKVVDEYKITRP